MPTSAASSNAVDAAVAAAVARAAAAEREVTDLKSCSSPTRARAGAREDAR